MSEPTKDAAIDTVNLLIHYSFDLGGYTAEKLVNRWCAYYSPVWIRAAVIEALYQGRYKAISVDQILRLWQRRNHPLYHFNMEFERIVCSTLPRRLTGQTVGSSVAEGRGQLPGLRALVQPVAEAKAYQNGAAEDGFMDDPGAEGEAVFAMPVASTDDANDANDANDVNKADNADSSVETILDNRNQPDLDTPIVGHQLSEPQLQLAEATPYAIAEDISPADETSDRDLSHLPLFSEPNVCNSPTWARRQTAQQPIDQFVPAPEASGFYTRLKAVAHSSEQDGLRNHEESHIQNN